MVNFINLLHYRSNAQQDLNCHQKVDLLQMNMTCPDILTFTCLNVKNTSRIIV